MSNASDEIDPHILKTQPVTAVVTRLRDMAEAGPVSVDDMVSRFGKTAFAPLMLLPAILLVSPLSGVPLFSTICGAVIFLIAVQGALGRERIWLPGRLLQLTLSQDRAEVAAESVARAGAFVDRHTRRRFVQLQQPQVRRGLYALCAVTALFFPVMEVVPFTSSILGAGIAFVAIAILARDGLFALIGVTFMAVAVAIPLTVFDAVLDALRGV